MTWDDLTAEERAVAYSANADRLMTPAELSRYWRVMVDAPLSLSFDNAHARAVADFLARRRAGPQTPDADRGAT